MVNRSFLQKLFCLAAICLLATTTSQTTWGAGSYAQVNLTSDIPGLAAFTDPNLKNPWGISFAPTSPFWISDQRTNVATLYNGLGAPQALVVTVPPTTGTPTGPTGQVFNPNQSGATPDFVEPNGSAAAFIFATLAGTIDAWNGLNGTIATIVATTPSSAYTGLALANNGSGNLLYAANFRGARIDVFNSSFAPVAISLVDPTIPAGYAPYNIENVGGNLYVEYAQAGAAGAVVGPGLGFVSVFNPNGTFVRRLISNGPLNAPWGITLAPSGFGNFSGDLLVGNFGDGRVNAFDPASGAFLGFLQDVNGNAISDPGLWALKVRTGGANVNTSAVYFAAGINAENNGLFGLIQAVPEPSTMLLVAGTLALAISLRKKVRH
jgi:uncharacterized protein (TIGR03118 family)